MKSAMAVPTNIPALMSATVQEVFRPDELFIADVDVLAEDAIRIMDSKSLRVVLVSKNDQVVGIVTTSDMLFKVLSNGRDPTKLKLGNIMTSPILSVDPTSSVQHALSLMDKSNIRQVCVRSSGGQVLGVLEREDIFDKMHLMTNSSASIAKPMCPYCNSYLASKDVLAAHVEEEHVTDGLPEIEARLHYRKPK